MTHTAPARTAPAALDFPAVDGRPVTEAHARVCRERGHARHLVDGADVGACPRCGEVTIVANFPQDPEADPADYCEGCEATGHPLTAGGYCPTCAAIGRAAGHAAEIGDDLDPEYLAWLDAEEAVAEGRATALMPCNLCLTDVHARLEPGAGPLRGITTTRVVNPADPTEVYALTCGHTVM